MKLYTKRDWLAAPASPPKWRWRKPRMVVVHHLGLDVEGLPPAEVMRRTQRFHQRDKGWSDIAYHYVIDLMGDAWEGRGTQRMGGATRGYNDVSIAVALMGDFNHDPLFQVQKDAIDNLYWANKFVHPRISKLVGHGELLSTECPGRNVQDYIREGRNRKRWG